MNRATDRRLLLIAWGMAVTGSFAASAQVPTVAPGTASSTAPAAASSALDALSWLRGCWAGKVEQWDFAEQWLPPRSGMMIGVSHTIVADRQRGGEARTDDYTYLRLEARADGVYYIAIPSGKKEIPFKLTSVAADRGDKIFTFTGPGDGFPQRILYRHTQAGSLYAHVAGKVDDRDKEVIYPMQHVDCATGAAAHE